MKTNIIVLSVMTSIRFVIISHQKDYKLFKHTEDERKVLKTLKAG